MDTVKLKSDAKSVGAWLRANVPPEEWPSLQDHQWLRQHPYALKGMYTKAELREFAMFRKLAQGGSPDWSVLALPLAAGDAKQPQEGQSP